MVVRNALVLLGLSSLVLTAGCAAQTPVDEPAEGQASQPIINGTKDTTHDAVVALLGQFSECTGTVFSVDSNQKIAYVLSAGHCVNEPGQPADPLQVAIIGTNYNNPVVQYPVVKAVTHPNWPNNDAYDFSIVTINWAGKQEPPVIPLITVAQDDLAKGSIVDFVGYGVTDSNPNSPGYNNSIRYHKSGPLQQVQAVTVSYDQTAAGVNGGPCSGDSGGPALYNVGGVEVVAAVTSNGDAQCKQFGNSARVSAVLDWINTCVSGGDCGGGGATTCDTCSQDATAQNGACGGSVDACVANADCKALLVCFNNCQTQACFDQCAKDNANGLEGYNAILTCVCTTGCQAECKDAAFCQSAPAGCGFQADPTCQTCLDASCCAESQACADDAACADCFTNPNADPACLDQNGNAKALVDCLTTNCPGKCDNGGGGTGGAGGAGGGGAGGAGGSATGGTDTGGGAGTGAAGGAAGGAGGAGGDTGGSGGNDETTTVTECHCRAGAGNSTGDGSAVAFGMALIGLLAARRRRSN